MATAFEDVFKVAQEHDVSLRIASYMLAIDRVATVYRLRGIFA